MKVLNLYAGIGGNRKLWEDVEVTAIEWDEAIAEIYQGFFPNDKVIVTDAHQYLLEHYKEFDFIWSSPPCPSHTILNHILNAQGIVRYPDMKLYEEIIFLQSWFNGLYCIENVRSYYKPLIKPQELDRHYFWANFLIAPYKPIDKGFNITNSRESTRRLARDYIDKLEEHHGFSLEKYEFSSSYKRRLALRNCVYPPLGAHILRCARGNTQKDLSYFTNKSEK